MDKRERCMYRKEKILLGAVFFLGGKITGFLISPIKEGIYCGNNNGNYLTHDKNEIEKEVILADTDHE